MILALDIGNSQIFGGLFREENLVFTFRLSTHPGISSDQLGLFLRQVLRENSIDPSLVRQTALCSVVPDLLHTIGSSVVKYFGHRPFVLQPGAKTGLKIQYRNPIEVGADRIANAIGAIDRFPKQHLLIIDFGTATTICCVTASQDYLGGVILPGIRISMEALVAKTAKLPKVEIIKPHTTIGRSTVESIQSGLYYGSLGAISHLCQNIKAETFQGERTKVIGTGGFSRLFEAEGLFDEFIPELVLFGLRKALTMNSTEESRDIL